MANHPSAEKRNRQRIVRTERNKAVRSLVRSAVKKARTAIAAGDDTAKDKAREATRQLAKAAKKGVLHPKTASRTTARIQHALAKQS